MYSIYSAVAACFHRNQQNLPDRIEDNERAFKATIQTPGGKTFFILSIIPAAGLIGVGYFLGIGGAVGTYCFIVGGAGLFLLDVTVLAVQSCRNASRLQAYIRRQQTQENNVPANDEEAERLAAEVQQLRDQLEEANQQLEQANQQQPVVPVNNEEAVQLRQRIAGLEGELQQAALQQQSVEQLKMEVKQLQQNLQEANEKRQQQEQVNQKSEGWIDTFTSELESQPSQLDQVKKEITQSYQQDLQEIMVEQERLTLLNLTQLEENKNIKTINDQLKEDINAKEKTIEQLQSELKSLKKLGEQLGSEYLQKKALLEKKIVGLEGQVGSLEKKNSDAVKSANDILDECKSKMEEVEKLKLELETLREEGSRTNNQLSQKICELEDNITKLNREKEELIVVHLAEQKSSNSIWREGCNTVKIKYTQEIENLKSELNRLKSISFENKSFTNLTSAVAPVTTESVTEEKEETGNLSDVLKEVRGECSFLGGTDDNEVQNETLSVILRQIDENGSKNQDSAQKVEPEIELSNRKQKIDEAFRLSALPSFPVNEESIGKEEVSSLGMPLPPPSVNLYDNMAPEQAVRIKPAVNKMPRSKQSELPPLMDTKTREVIQSKLRSDYSVVMKELIDDVKKYFREKMTETSANEASVSDVESTNCSIIGVVNEEALDINVEKYLKELSRYMKAVKSGPERNKRIKLVVQSLKEQIAKLTPSKGNKGEKLSKEEQELKLRKLESEKKEQLEKAFLNATNFQEFEKMYNLQDLKEDCFPLLKVAMANANIILITNNHNVVNVETFNQLNNKLRLKINEVKDNKSEESIKELNILCQTMKEVLLKFSRSNNTCLNNIGSFFKKSVEVEREEKKEAVGYESNSNVPCESEGDLQKRLQDEIKSIMTFVWAEGETILSGDVSSLQLDCLNEISDDRVSEELSFEGCEILTKQGLIELNAKVQKMYGTLNEAAQIDMVQEDSVKKFKVLCKPLLDCLKAIENSTELPKMKKFFGDWSNKEAPN